MTRYMVIERFRAGNSAAVYDRFAGLGHMLPDGLIYLDSWLSADDCTCYQLMETDSPQTFDNWIAHWNDLVDFEVLELKDKPTGSIS